MINTIELAKEFNVSEVDLVGFAQMIASSMQQDGLNETHVNNESISAYAMDQVKKTQSFTNKYLTNPDAREAFIQTTVAALS